MRALPYHALAARVMQPFVGDCLTPERLLELTRTAYGRFAHAAVTPLVQLDEQQWLLELFHGPTLAFKDVALQLLGLLFEEFLGRSDQNLTIVGATSGDTGSAANGSSCNVTSESSDWPATGFRPRALMTTWRKAANSSGVRFGASAGAAPGAAASDLVCIASTLNDGGLILGDYNLANTT